MDLLSVVILILACLILISFILLYKTRTRLKEMDGFRAIKEPGDHLEDDVIDSFGD